MTVHTTGPLMVVSRENGYAVVSTGTDAPWEPLVAEVWRKADADLFAAAPDLLAALRECVEQGIWPGHNGTDSERANDIYHRASALLARVDGGA